MMPPQGSLSIDRMCALAGVSRRSYYRHWRREAPRPKRPRYATRCSGWRWRIGSTDIAG